MSPKISIILKSPKTCAVCGAVHTSVPERHRFDREGEVYYWECGCDNTLTYIPDFERTKRLMRAPPREHCSMSMPEYLPSEREDIDTVIAAARNFGYGNLISRLKDAWSKHLQKVDKTDKTDKVTADMAAGHICVWCKVDMHTGKKVKQ